MIKPYYNFSEVEAEIRAATKDNPIVYKYRDWKDQYHRRIITNREAWFAHPHKLNDPYDVRPPYNFVVGNIDWTVFRQRLYEAGREIEPSLSEAQLNIEVDERLKEAQADPIAYFQKTRAEYINQEAHFDQIGVFSCCTSIENEPMWANYGSNHEGFAIGFEVIEMCRSTGCTVGYVEYSDTPVDYYVLEDNSAGFDREIFKKGERWKAEEEFRFITAGIGRYRERATIFPPEAVQEIVFGMNTDADTQHQIMEEAAKSLPNASFYKMQLKAAAYGLQKVKL